MVAAVPEQLLEKSMLASLVRSPHAGAHGPGEPAALVLAVGQPSYLQAPDDTCIAVWHIMAEQVNLTAAGLLHGVLEINVLRELYLFTHEA